MSSIVEEEERYGLPATPDLPANGFRPPNLALTTIGLRLGTVRVRRLPPELPRVASGQYLDGSR